MVDQHDLTDAWNRYCFCIAHEKWNKRYNLAAHIALGIWFDLCAKYFDEHAAEMPVWQPKKEVK